MGEGYRQAWYFFPKLSLTSLPNTLLELARAKAHEWCCSSLVCCWNEGERSSFYRWRRGCSLEDSLFPYGRSKPPFRYIESAQHPISRLWRGGMNQPSKVGLEAGQHGYGRTMGAPAPLLGHLESNFVRGSSLIF